MRSYETARRLFPIIEMICAGVFALGLIVFIYSLVNAGEYFSLQYFLTGSAGILGLFLSFAALLGFLSCQVARALVDTAEFSQQSLQVARDQLETSRQLLRAAYQKPQTFASAAKASKHAGKDDAPTYSPEASALPASAPPVTGYHHRGHTIERANGKFVVAGETFFNFGEAKAHVDGLLDAPSDRSGDPKALEP